MILFGQFMLFITGFLWSWGAEVSKKIKLYEGYHSSPWTFWGGYHRFNRWIFNLTEGDLDIIQSISQGLLAALFFLPVSLIAGAWSYWWILLVGGMSFILIKELVLRIKKKQD